MHFPHTHRYEFMECLIRVAFFKYITGGAGGGCSMSTAVVLLFEKDLEPHASPSAKVSERSHMDAHLTHKHVA